MVEGGEGGIGGRWTRTRTSNAGAAPETSRALVASASRVSPYPVSDVI